MPKEPDQKPKGIIQLFVDGLNGVADAVASRIKGIFQPTPSEDVRRAEEGVRRASSGLDGLLEEAQKDFGYYHAAQVIVGEEVSEGDKAMHGITDEWVEEVKEYLAENIAKHGRPLPDELHEEYGSVLYLHAERLESKIREVLGRDAVERLGVEAPNRDSDSRSKGK